MSKWLSALLFSVTAICVAWPGLAADTENDQSRPPVITITLEVQTPQGGARSFSASRPDAPRVESDLSRGAGRQGEGHGAD